MTDDRKPRGENGPLKCGLPSRSSHRHSASGNRQCGSALRAFTLIELLTVIAILGILATIAITVGRGVQERGKIARAKAEMAVLAAALEQYKAQYGDYPWTPEPLPNGFPDGGVLLFNALCGNLRPTGVQLGGKGKTFVELARFDVDPAQLPDPDLPTLKVNWFNDPWGGWYYYRYKTAAGDPHWKAAGFLLYSHGPDTRCNLGLETQTGTPIRSGLLEDFPDDSEADNADNIYFGRD